MTLVTVTAVGVLTAMIVGLAIVVPIVGPGVGANGWPDVTVVEPGSGGLLAGGEFLALSQTAVPRAKARTMQEIAMSFFIWFLV